MLSVITFVLLHFRTIQDVYYHLTKETTFKFDARGTFGIAISKLLELEMKKACLVSTCFFQINDTPCVKNKRKSV